MAMKADQYSGYDSVKVKARAGYLCEFCGSSQMVQAHAPNGDHSDWREGICLCAGCHANQHPGMPRNLFFTEMQQPYWPNVSARALATEFGCHNRTIIRAAKKLRIASGVDLSEVDKQRLRELVIGKGRGVVEIPCEGRDANYPFTLAEAAKILNVHVNTAYHLVRTGELKASRIMFMWRVLPGNLKLYAQKTGRKVDRKSVV